MATKLIGRFTFAKLKGDEAAVIVYCPSCPDGTGHCELDPKGVGFCHRCGTGFSLTPAEKQIVGSMLGTPRKGHGRPRKPTDGLGGSGSTPKTRKVPPQGSGVPPSTSPWGSILGDPISRRSLHYRYLAGRGLTERHIETLAPRLGSDPWMAYFPVWDHDGLVSYVVGRTMAKKCRIRYWYPPKIRVDTGKSEHVWGVHLPQRNREYVVTEGIFDAVFCKGGLAILGSRISDTQMALIKKLDPRKITIALDSDRHARYECGNHRCKTLGNSTRCLRCGSQMRERANDMLEALRLKRFLGSARVEVARLPRSMDPADLKGDLNQCQTLVI